MIQLRLFFATSLEIMRAYGSRFLVVYAVTSSKSLHYVPLASIFWWKMLKIEHNSAKSVILFSEIASTA